MFQLKEKTTSNCKLEILLNFQTDQWKQRKTTSDGTTRMPKNVADIVHELDLLVNKKGNYKYKVVH